MAHSARSARGRVRIALLVVGIFLVVQGVVAGFGPLTVNDEIDCGTIQRPAHAPTGNDAALCRRGLAEQRVWAVGSGALAALALLGFVLVPRDR